MRTTLTRGAPALAAVCADRPSCRSGRQRLLPPTGRCAMMRPMGTSVDDALQLLLAERAISRVLHSYSRGADRCDLELMRSCYWPDGTDDHGSYNGGVDGFIEFVGPALQRFERTNHFLGNMLIDVDLAQRRRPRRDLRRRLPPLRRCRRQPGRHGGRAALRRPLRASGRRVAHRGARVRVRVAPDRTRCRAPAAASPRRTHGACVVPTTSSGTSSTEVACGRAASSRPGDEPREVEHHEQRS